jgi:hypothetical protein
MRDEHYVIDLCDKVLRLRAKRQHRFDFLRGDTGRTLPVDTYYPTLSLVVEFRERQHFESVPLFDQRIVAGGITRKQQRQRYDLRRRRVLPKHGLRIVELTCTQFECDGRLRLTRNQRADRIVVKAALSRFLSRRSDT